MDLEQLHGSQAAPLARQLRQAMGKPDSPVRQPSAAPSEQLIRRQVSILKRLESGLSNKEIAGAISSRPAGSGRVRVRAIWASTRLSNTWFSVAAEAAAAVEIDAL